MDRRVGAWRSLVAHLNGVQGVDGSNPFAPTNFVNQLHGGCFRHIGKCDRFKSPLTPAVDLFNRLTAFLLWEWVTCLYSGG
jgi:hypothetical protein